MTRTLRIASCLGLLSFPGVSLATFFPELLFEDYETTYAYSYVAPEPSNPPDFSQTTSVGVIGDLGRVIDPGFKGNIKLDVLTPFMASNGASVKLWTQASWDYDYDPDNGFGYYTASFNAADDSFSVDPVQFTQAGIAVYGADMAYWRPGESIINAIGYQPIRGGAGSNLSEIIPTEVTIGQTYAYYSSEAVNYTTSAELLQAFDVGLEPGTYIVTEGQQELLIEVIYLGVDLLQNFRQDEDFAPSPDAWALVRAVQTTIVGDETMTTYRPDGDPLAYSPGPQSASSTVLEWRVNGMGTVKGIIYSGAIADGINSGGFFLSSVPADYESGQALGVTPLAQSVYTQMETSRFERVSGSTEVSLVDVPDPVIDASGRIRLLETLAEELDSGGGSSSAVNSYDAGSNRLHLQVDAGSAGLLSLSFQIQGDGSSGIMHALPETVTTLQSANPAMASFDAATGELAIPALTSGNQTLFTDVVFQLTNSETLQFTLSSFRQP